MDALDLIMAGRALTRIGESVLRGSPDRPPAGMALVLRDVLTHPGSSISEITNRTGLPQGYVSATVARLRERGTCETAADPADGRRTLVRLSAGHLRAVAVRGSADAGPALAAALRDGDQEMSPGELIEALAQIARRLRPDRPGPVLRSIAEAQGGS